MCRGPSSGTTPLRASACSGRHPKPHRLGGLDHRNLFSHSSRGCGSNTKASVDAGSGEGSLPGLHVAALLLNSHMAFPWCTGTCACHLTLITFLPSSNTAVLRVRAPTYTFGRGRGRNYSIHNTSASGTRFHHGPMGHSSLRWRPRPCTPVLMELWVRQPSLVPGFF